MARIPGLAGVTMALAVVNDAASVMPLALGGRPRRIVPMVVGFEVIAEAVSVAGGSGFRHLLEPVTAAAVVFDEGWVLIDGGFDPARIRDRSRRVASFDYENYTPVVPAGDPLVDQVDAAGLRSGELAAALLSHAHFDHTGAARLLSPDQPLLLQRREWEHVRSSADHRADFLFPGDLDRPGLTIGLLDGDAELAPGLRALDTRGHTPGHQSFAVELPEETVVFACDAADLRENIDGAIPCGSTVGPEGPGDAMRAIQRLRELDRGAGVSVWPGHDPQWTPWSAVIEQLSARSVD